MINDKKLERDIRKWANAHRLNSSSSTPFNKYSNINLAYADQALRGNRGKLFIVNGKLYNSQSGRMIPTRNALKSDFFGWLFTDNENDIRNIISDMRPTEIRRFTSKTYDGNYGNYKKYSGVDRASSLKLSQSLIDKILRK